MDCIVSIYSHLYFVNKNCVTVFNKPSKTNYVQRNPDQITQFEEADFWMIFEQNELILTCKFTWQ